MKKVLITNLSVMAVVIILMGLEFVSSKQSSYKYSLFYVNLAVLLGIVHFISAIIWSLTPPTPSLGAKAVSIIMGALSAIMTGMYWFWVLSWL